MKPMPPPELLVPALLVRKLVELLNMVNELETFDTDDVYGSSYLLVGRHASAEVDELVSEILEEWSPILSAIVGVE